MKVRDMGGEEFFLSIGCIFDEFTELGD